MMTLIFAAALAAQTQPAPAPGQQAPHQHMQMGQNADHKGMDCCKECCKDMAKEHEGHVERSGQTGR